MNELDIIKHLIHSGIRRGDVLMIHGDAIVTSQLNCIPKAQMLEIFFKKILSYLGPEGTLVIPSFSYSFANSQKFNVQHTPSEIGKFSEDFRLLYSLSRSRNPFFSVVAVGKLQSEFQSSSIDECFGPNSIFDLLYKNNAKLMCFGCSFNQLTFTHYLEQAMGVEYRYFKWFEGNIIDHENIIQVKTKYFVGNLSFNYSLNLDQLKNNLLIRDKIKITPFGRLCSYTVSAQAFYECGEKLLIKNKYALINESLLNGIN